MTVLVAGAHGVGKTFLAKPAAERLGFRYATASQLIRDERGHATWTETRQVTQIDENQIALARAVARILDGGLPATIIRSDCRGEKRITSEPKREISNRLAPAAINSIAQQARPIGIGQREFLRNQLSTASARVTITSPSILEL